MAVAGVAGAVCGPGAVACGATFATGANAVWDTSDTLISGEKRGLVRDIGEWYESFVRKRALVKYLSQSEVIKPKRDAI